MTEEQKTKLSYLIHNKLEYEFPNKAINVVQLATQYYKTGFYRIILTVPELINLEYANQIETEIKKLIGDEYLLKQEMTNIKYYDKVTENEEEVFILELNFYITARNK